MLRDLLLSSRLVRIANDVMQDETSARVQQQEDAEWYARAGQRLGELLDV